MNKEHFRTIRKAIENNKLAIFVGSAISYDSNLPSWADLVDLMKSALEAPRTNDYLKIAEHYYLQYGRNTYYSKISEFFPEGSQPNELHELLLKLKPQHIVTTNWDDLLEKSIINAGVLYFKVASDHDLASSPSSQLLIKMHGDLSHRNIVFKESDYLSYTDKFPLIENFIKSLFSTHVVLFVGYSISDHNLNQILSWIRNRTQDAPPSFTILTENKITLSEANYLREKGVYPLLSDGDESTQEHPNLSTKSGTVAKTIKTIIHPENIETLDILNEIATDISNWTLVHPTYFVQLIRDRLNIIETNKIYYDPVENAIIYNLYNEENTYSRYQYRKIRKALLRFLNFIPVTEIQITTSSGAFYKLSNFSDFDFINEYTTFNLNLINKRIGSKSTKLNSNLDDEYQTAFDNYYLKRLQIARESFMHIANQYFSKSLFIKSLASSFNKKQLCFGEIPWEIHEQFLETSMEERLSRNDNISEMIDKFPKSIISRQKALFHGLDASNSFLLEQFKQVSNIYRDIDQEINKVKKGAIIIESRKLETMQNQAHLAVLFIIKNRISVLYSQDYANIAKMSFEACIKIQKSQTIEINEILSYLAIVAFKGNDLIDFLSENLENNRVIEISEDTFDYIFEVLENCISSMSSLQRESKENYISFKWSNALTILSYAKHDEVVSKKILEHLASAFDTYDWANLSESINRFLALQAKRYRNPFPEENLKLILNKQIEKINASANLPPNEHGRLFSNLINLIKKSEHHETDLFSDNKEIQKLIYTISMMNISDRLRAIDGFIFLIYSLASGKIQKDTINLLLGTFKELKKSEISENSIIFGLNMHNLGLLKKAELKFILLKLKEITTSSLEKRSYTNLFAVIRDQLLQIPTEDSKGFEETIENVSKISIYYSNSIRRLINYQQPPSKH